MEAVAPWLQQAIYAAVAGRAKQLGEDSRHSGALGVFGGGEGMAEAMTDKEKREADKWVFETFATIYPHEAAAVDWPRFVAFTQSKNPAIPEEEIRRLLKETAE